MLGLILQFLYVVFLIVQMYVNLVFTVTVAYLRVEFFGL